MYSARSEVTGETVTCFFNEDDLCDHLEEISVEGDFWDLYRDGRMYSYYIPVNSR